MHIIKIVPAVPTLAVHPQPSQPSASALLCGCAVLRLSRLQLFANSDIGNLTKDKSCCPPKDYMEAVWGSCPPVQCERDRSFDFRRFCSTKVSCAAHAVDA
jgi:hypothetical protein